MAVMNTQKQFMFWSGTFVLALLFVFIFKAVLLPFVLGFAIAYLLNPLVEALRKFRIPRGPAALIILGLFFVAVIAIFAAILPLAYDQFLQLSADMPKYVDGIWSWLQPLTDRVQALTGQAGPEEFKALFKEHLSAAFGVGKTLIESIWAGGQAFLNFISVTIFTPVVAYFAMKEWNRLKQWVNDIMPRDHKETITDLIEQIDTKLSGFIRGQLTVAFILAIAYGLALSFAGLKYGFLIGLLSGVLSIIPMVGSSVGLIVGVLVAWFQSSDWLFVLTIAGIFLGGQLIEGNFITPKLVGKSVGLHPLWIFFALLAGGALFGILGMFLAVPVAAVIGVLAAFGLKQYKQSSLYNGSKKSAKGKGNA
ncbi:MAG: AI-2E family transporter [Alphaproteobacteria bacterium]|nr:AI-2E family transporter [Alphaproteobacteria bacterium]